MDIYKENEINEVKRANIFVYYLVRLLAFVVSKIIYNPQIIRNELKETKGGYIVIANHQSALDVVNVLPLTRRRMCVIVSLAYYNTLPFPKLRESLHFIAKQQFQTSFFDLKKMFNVINNDIPLLIYPAGLMCEDGLSTPIPLATYNFLKLAKKDIYVVRTDGSYLTMPKWSKVKRRGKVFIDAYKLIDKEEIASLSELEIKEIVDKALLFDEYQFQEEKKIIYKNGSNIVGIENVLYKCPNCHEEFSFESKDLNTLSCNKCGYSLQSDKYGFLYDENNVKFHVSDLSQKIYDELKQDIISGKVNEITASGILQMIDFNKHQFTNRGNIVVRLDYEGFHINSELDVRNINKLISINNMPTIPFKPGKTMDMQEANTTYRLLFDEKDGSKAQKFAQMVEIFYELNNLNN